MRKYLLFMLFIISMNALAHSDLDDMFLERGLVDKNFKIIDRKKYVSFFREMNKENVESMPLYIDSERRILNLNISPNAFNTTMQIDGIKSKEDIYPKNWLRTSLSNFCKGYYAQSKTILQDGGMVITALIVNDDFESIQTFSFDSRECPSFSK
ncbi:hypothetical protein N5J44_09850 [Acinetobacter ursingii]|uniref:hypothetical protein n=1 Tax=Acinetobacter ursingii TaxID=108980 RepID=UPI0024497DF5|nr:hypothetical protein [Acinetobacter ursingii]MDH2019421.1 hypothetical protein [Acinetobacter ursingii]MDH2071841.1 hypothetical protein [Acinetobacter ursingii]